MKRHRGQQQDQTERIRRAVRQRIDTDQRLHEQISGDQEVHDHHLVTDVVDHRPPENRRVIEGPQRAGEDDRRDNRIRQERPDRGMHRDEDPLPRTTTLVGTRADSPHREGHRSPRHEQHRNHHSQQHVGEHVG